MRPEVVLHIDHRFRRGLSGLGKHPGGTIKELITLLLDLVRMDIEILRQRDQPSGGLCGCTAATVHLRSRP